MTTCASEPDRLDPDLRMLRAQRRAAERARELAELLQERPELRGTYAPADLAVDSVRWGV